MNPKLYFDDFVKSTRVRIIAFTIVIILITLSCTLSSTNNTALQGTKVALEAQMTILAQQSSQNAALTAAAQQAGSVAQNAQATLLAQQAAQLAQQATELAQQQTLPQTEPPPLVTKAPVTVPPAQATEPPTSPDLESKIKNAKILLFEDLAGQKVWATYLNQYIYPARYVKDALDMGGYTYKDDGSAQGWFKDDLLSTTDWDLIVVSSEARTRIQGEYFQYLLEHINRGTGLIIEMWYAYNIQQGKIAPLLAKCGVEVYGDLPDTESLALWPFIPDHPVFNYPNSGVSLRNSFNFWGSGNGNLLRKTSSGDATLLAGTIATAKTDHATLVSCLQGRLILMTFCSHDHAQGDITRLWENEIYYVLKNKFTTSP
jgi:hypothetical protein